MQMIPRLIDKPRQARILGVDMTPGTINVNPKQPEAFKETPQGLSINPNVGRYDVRVVAGASFATQRTQAQQAFAEMMRGSPEMMPVVAPFWAQTLDIPNADKLAQAFAAMAPGPVKAILQPQGEQDGPSTAELMAKVEELQAALQEATSIAHEAQQDADEAHDKAEDKSEENEIRRYEAETNRLKVTGANVEQIEAIVAELVNQMLTSPAPIGDEQPPAMDDEPQPESAEMQPLPGDLGQDAPEPQPMQME